MVVAAISRNRRNLDQLRATHGWSEDAVKLYACDATSQGSADKAIESISLDLGVPSLVIYLVQDSQSAVSIDTEPTALEDMWRANCLGAFIIARKAAKLMMTRGHGTIIFAGATSAIIGRPGYLTLAVGKFSLRALSQVMARELWPLGIHVVHVLIDGGGFHFGRKLDDSVGTDPEAAAKTFLMLHNQPKNSWTHELDLRPWNERFWKHC